MGGGLPAFGGWGGTKTQRIAMNFGVLVIGLGQNHRSIDELAQTKKLFVFGHPNVYTSNSIQSIKKTYPYPSISKST